MPKWTQQFDFILSKEEEEAKGRESGIFPLTPVTSHIVQIRDDSPSLLCLLKPWEFKKVLTSCDVGGLPGLVLGREHVQNHWGLKWKYLNGGAHVPITIRDVDTGSNYNLLIRKFGDEDNFLIHNNWIKEFVVRRGLKEGDTIGMFWNKKWGIVGFSVLERAPPAMN